MKKSTFKTAFFVISLLLLIPGLFFPQDNPIKLKVVADLANIRERPAIDSPIIKQAEKNEIIEALGLQGEWFRVVFLKDTGEASTGYVHQSLVIITEGSPEKVTPLVIKPVEEDVPSKKKAAPSKKPVVQSTPQKPQIETPQIDQPPPSKRGVKRFGFRLSIGSNYVSAEQLNQGAEGLADFYRYNLGQNGIHKVRPFHLSYLASSEVFVPLNRIFYLGFGFDYYRGELESVVKFDRVEYADYYSARPRVDALPISLSITAYPTPFIYFKVGVEFYFARAQYYYRYQTEDFWQEWSGRANAEGAGLMAGAGYEYEIAPFASLFVEAVGHYAKIDGFKGTDNYRESTSYTYSESGSMFFYTSQLGLNESVPLLYIRERKPAEAWVENASEALIDYSGVSLKVGIKFWF